MPRLVLILVLGTAVGCVTAPPPPPAPAPCPNVEPPPCDAITPEQRAVLDLFDQILEVPLSEQGEALRGLIDARDGALEDVARTKKELEACRRSNAELQERVGQLEADLEELERLTIEMELKAK